MKVEKILFEYLVTDNSNYDRIVVTNTNIYVYCLTVVSQFAYIFQKYSISEFKKEILTKNEIQYIYYSNLDIIHKHKQVHQIFLEYLK